MNTADVNVLVAASRSDHPNHAVAAQWLGSVMDAEASSEKLFLLTAVVTGFLRVVTHPRVFVEPTPIAHAWKYLDALLAQRGVQILEADASLNLFQEITTKQNLVGNAIPDAWIASKVRNHHMRLATFDRGFRKYLRPSMLTLLNGKD